MKLDCRQKSALPLVAVAFLVVYILSGCSRDELSTKEEVYTDRDNNYMRDPVFQKQLKEGDTERRRIAARRVQAMRKLDALVEKCGGDRSAAEKLPEWAALTAETKACDEEFARSRKRTAAQARERIARAMADGERVRRGEAKEKKISK